jgi:hypothetical protein
MRTNLFQLFYFLGVMALVLSSCNLPVSNPVTETPSQLVQAMVASTETPDRAATQTSQAVLLPTDTAMVTATETPLPEPTFTATPEYPKAEVNRETNCRLGPGGLYDLVATYQAGQMLDVVGMGLAQGYWYIQNPDKAEEQCYLLAQNVTLSGDSSALPKFTPPPSPTSAPYFEASFKKFDNCKGDFANFSVENTGSTPFRSAYIKVTDTKVSKSVEHALNAFDLFVGCTLAKNIAPLDPGETGYVHSPTFNWVVHRDKLQAVIMLCTEKDLKGMCVTRTLEVKK